MVLKSPRWFVALGIACGMGACLSYPGAEQRSYENVVVTKYDRTVNFASFSSFAIVRDVPLLGGTLEGSSRVSVSREIAEPIIRRVADQLRARGYEQVLPEQNPDLGISISLVSRLNVDVAVYPGYWWGYPGYYGSSYWGYPGFSYYAPWYYSTYAWKSGTLVVEAVNLRDGAGVFVPEDAGTRDSGTGNSGTGNSGESGRLVVDWAAFVHGVFDELEGVVLQRVLANVDEAFAQSPYLTR